MSAPNQTELQFLGQSPKSWTLLAIVLGVLALGYGLLPIIGIDLFKNLFSFNKVAALIVASITLGVYWRYLQWIQTRAMVLACFTIAVWPFIDYLNSLLLDTQGINLHLRLWVMGWLVLPTAIMAFKARQSLWQQVTSLRWWGIFLALVIGYFLFRNVGTLDPRMGIQATATDGSVAILQLCAYIYNVCAMVLGVLCIQQAKEPLKTFDQLNQWLLGSAMLMACVVLIGFPLGAFGTNIDGFYRANGLFGHPNVYAHHLGMLTLYFAGLLLYYQNNKRLSLWVIAIPLALTTGTLLLALSKTAIALVLLGLAILAVLNFSWQATRPFLIKWGITLALFATIAGLVYSLFTGNDIGAIIEARLNQQESFNWRMWVWQQLLANLSGLEYLWGKGFTAANQWVFQLTYNTKTNVNPLILVHNGYVAILYDFGLLGYSVFMAIVSTLVTALKYYRKYLAERPLSSLVIVMSIYFLCAIGFDELLTMFDAPVLFWLLTATILTLLRYPQKNLGESR